MYNDTPEFSLNGVLLNPLASRTTLKNVIAEVQNRLEAGTLSDDMKVKLVHALSVAKGRLDG